ncbi:UDP-GlcNAc:undecaprenyl-phosphate GlcNAc-1-phosphate transferase [Lysobacter niastensis]|uniref:UDP-GlcNAc:undecaprenyl-phosphate GlcNAc-1-phosphate transferase n=1 Tax=Lysobacter niastensis TaxID=380629 RepID=A0ABU1WES1_9GAMM|nr:MraY family glycosyltransferase [Lysobacter niastensis]MDR7135850.1 UDP-GlcNAc:undecaprenyl-phosphate GlcNAc-1-phosphate transferase [Lysobacter niastensis]
MIELVSAERGLAAAGLTFLVQWLLRPVAHRWNLLDHPKGRKDHSHPTPITGGLAIAVGVVVTGLSMLQATVAMYAFCAASILLIVVGLLDDKYDLRWYWRVLAQSVAALVMVYLGGVRIEQLGPVFGLGETSLGMLSVPFTVFATVGLINAINMVDGADGLAGLLVTGALVMLTAAALYAGNGGIADHTLILIGSVGAFLTYNMRLPWQPRAKVFLGNAGSAFLGFVIAWISFSLTQNPGHPVSPVLALWFVPVPVMDCLVLIARRLCLGKSPFIADRNHIHHIMQEGGFGPTQVALALALFSGICGLAAGQAMRMDVPQPLLLVAFLGLCFGWYRLTGRRERVVGMFRALRGHSEPAVVLRVMAGFKGPERSATRVAETEVEAA